ncbi:MAG: hypothetical protein SGILL_009040 [Bacillariaceae sp.]
MKLYLILFLIFFSLSQTEASRKLRKSDDGGSKAKKKDSKKDKKKSNDAPDAPDAPVCGQRINATASFSLNSPPPSDDDLPRTLDAATAMASVTGRAQDDVLCQVPAAGLTICALNFKESLTLVANDPGCYPVSAWNNVFNEYLQSLLPQVTAKFDFEFSRLLPQFQVRCSTEIVGIADEDVSADFASCGVTSNGESIISDVKLDVAPSIDVSCSFLDQQRIVAVANTGYNRQSAEFAEAVALFQQAQIALYGSRQALALVSKLFF